jgi:hypothetical protein
MDTGIYLRKVAAEKNGLMTHGCELVNTAPITVRRMLSNGPYNAMAAVEPIAYKRNSPQFKAIRTLRGSLRLRFLPYEIEISGCIDAFNKGLPPFAHGKEADGIH